MVCETVDYFDADFNKACAAGTKSFNVEEVSVILDHPVHFKLIW